jgi:hypothetical protein
MRKNLNLKISTEWFENLWKEDERLKAVKNTIGTYEVVYPINIVTRQALSRRGQ